MNRTRFAQLHFLAAALITTSATAEQPKELVRRAIESGHADGLVHGLVAEEARTRLNATGSLRLTAKRLYAFEQDGCARVQMNFVQGEALLPGQTRPEPYAWSVQVNVCMDGDAPLSLKRKTQ